MAAAALVAAALVVGLAMSTLFYVRAEAARRQDAGKQPQAYAAAIGAVDSSACGETGDAKRRLTDVPTVQRGWEWQHLFYRADSSLATLFAKGAMNWSPSLWSSFRFSSDATRLFWNSENVLTLWDAQTYRPIASYHGMGDILAIGPDGATILTRLSADAPQDGPSGEFGVHIVDVSTRQTVRRLTGVMRRAEYAAFSLDGRRVASTSGDGTVYVWDAQSGRQQASMKTSDGSACPLVFSPDGRRLAGPNLLGCRNGGVGCAPAGRQRESRVTFSPDSRLLATGSSRGIVRVFNAGPGALLNTFGGNAEEVFALAFSPDDQRLATAGNDGFVHLWDVKAGEEIAVINGHTPWEQVNSLAFAPSGERVFSGGRYGMVKVWDARASGSGVTLAQGARVTSLALAPDSQRLASGSGDGRIVLWDLRTRQPQATLTGHAGYVFGLAFDRAGSRIASAGQDKTARVWDVASGRTTVTLSSHAAEVNAVAFSPGGTELATGSEDRTIRVWDVLTGAELAQMGIPPSPQLRGVLTGG